MQIYIVARRSLGVSTFDHFQNILVILKNVHIRFVMILIKKSSQRDINYLLSDSDRYSVPLYSK